MTGSSFRVVALIVAVTAGAVIVRAVTPRTATTDTATTTLPVDQPDPCETAWTAIDRLSAAAGAFDEHIDTIRESLPTITGPELDQQWEAVQGRQSDMVPYTKAFNDNKDGCGTRSSACTAATQSASAWVTQVSHSEAFVGLIKTETFNRVWNGPKPETVTKLEHLFVRWDGIIADQRTLWGATTQNRGWCP